MVCVFLQGDWADQFERMRLREADAVGGGADAWAEQFERIMQKPEDQWAAEFDSLQASQGMRARTFCMHVNANRLAFAYLICIQLQIQARTYICIQ